MLVSMQPALEIHFQVNQFIKSFVFVIKLSIYRIEIEVIQLFHTQW